MIFRIAGLNPAGGMILISYFLCVDSGLYDGIITRSHKSHWMCKFEIVCDIAIRKRRPGPNFGCCATKINPIHKVRLKGFRTRDQKYFTFLS